MEELGNFAQVVNENQDNPAIREKAKEYLADNVISPNEYHAIMEAGRNAEYEMRKFNLKSKFY